MTPIRRGPAGSPRGRAGRRARWAAVLLLPTLVACRAAEAVPDASSEKASEQWAAAPQPGCPAAQDQDAATVAAVTGSLEQGQDLATALRQVFGPGLAGLTGTARAQALRVLADLDSCPTVGSTVVEDVPRLVRSIALGAPGADPPVAPPVAAPGSNRTDADGSPR